MQGDRFELTSADPEATVIGGGTTVSWPANPLTFMAETNEAFLSDH